MKNHFSRRSNQPVSSTLDAIEGSAADLGLLHLFPTLASEFDAAVLFDLLKEKPKFKTEIKNKFFHLKPKR